jgi:hypothetical protein
MVPTLAVSPVKPWDMMVVHFRVVTNANTQPPNAPMILSNFHQLQEVS